MAVETYPSFVVTKVVKRATTLAEDKISEIMGIDRELVKLKNELIMLQNIMEDAEQKQLSNPYVLRKWLEDLRFFALDAEDFLDEIATEASANMVRVKYTSPCANPDQFVSFRHKITHLTQMLDDIVTRKSDLNLMKLEEYSGQQEIATTMSMRRPEEGDMQQQQLELIGRDAEKNNIINQLIDVGGEPIVKIVPIIGMGGIGKTTLARSIFNEREVFKHFGFGKWVFVGENFDTVKVISKIISPDIDMEWSFPLETMQNKFLKEVLTKKFLIVLDNVCDIDQKVEEWKNFWILLKRGKKGGCVIVTSWNHKILPVIDEHNEVDYIQLERLEDNHCWSIFEKNAFADGNSYNCRDFKSIGWEIVREKVKGVPLAAKMVGKSLLGKYIKVWESFLQNEGWSLRKEGDDTMTVLRFCYHHLPPHLKSCFNYCATYPKAWRFDRKELILKWMALGFLEPAEVVNQRMEDTGETYFEDLLRRSFFEKNIYNQYVMHDLVHDLALLVSSGECNSTFANQGIDSWPKTVLHVSLASTQHFEKLAMEKCEKIRTISCWDQNEARFQYKFSEEFDYHVTVCLLCCDHVVMFKWLRVLDLSRITIGILPDSVGTLIHLRYLDVLFPHVNLPESITNLNNLQTLNVISEQDDHVINVPKDISKLINLRHLNVGIEISKRICGLKTLTSLQKLNLFVVEKDNGSRISDLRELNQLRGELWIWLLKDVDSREEATEANLKNKVHVTWLKLDWGERIRSVSFEDCNYSDMEVIEPPLEDCNYSNMEMIEPPREESAEDCNSDMEMIEPPLEDCNYSDMEVIEGLEPPQNLVHLEICRYQGTLCPSWLAMGNKQTLIQLEYLKFCECYELESIHLPDNVTELVLESCMNLKLFVDQILPNLKKLVISECPMLQFHNASFGDAASTIMFPALEELEISNNYLFKSIILRCRPTTFRTLVITMCDVVDISHFFNLEEVQWQDFTSFQHLRIEYCEDLTSILDEIHLLPYLRGLSINICDKLQSFPEKGLPKSLEFLFVSGCNEFAEKCQVGGSEWPKISHIPNISIHFY